MPRKPKREKHKITVVVNGTPITATLHPPGRERKSWYAYWAGLGAAKSTGTANLTEAMLIAENMLKGDGKRSRHEDAGLSDDELLQIQRAHYAKKQDPKARARAEKSLVTCLEAIDAFQQISGLKPVTLATADDCAAFQQAALELPKNWRSKHPKSKQEGVPQLSPNTVLKWSRALQAAFQRANIKAGKKCVRGVVPKHKLLTGNPWNEFTWIEGVERPVRQFSSAELLAVLEYLERNWPNVTVVSIAAKFCLWSWSRVYELASVTWNDLKVVGGEYHFQIVGKWGVEKWARIPEGLYRDLCEIRTESPFVFAAYNQQLRDHFVYSGRPHLASKVGRSFSPTTFVDWFQGRIASWGNTSGNPATPHVFRKTALQHARRGEDVNRQVAKDARLSESVMMLHYVVESDEERRQASNRTFGRIVASLPSEVAARYGHVIDGPAALFKAKIRDAVQAEDWALVAALVAEHSPHQNQDSASTDVVLPFQRNAV